MMDLGAHKGDASAFYLDTLGYRVVAVEAHPDLAAYNERCKLIAMNKDHLTIVNAAITPTGETAKLYTSNKGTDGETHSLYPHRVKGCEEVAIEVPGTTVPRLFKEHGVPKYLKIDIEGSDIHAVRQLHDCPYVPLHLSVELCQDHPEEALEIFAHLGYMGYHHLSLVIQSWHRTVDIDTVAYELGLTDAASWWFGKGKLPKDIWYDLHARHKDYTP